MSRRAAAPQGVVVISAADLERMRYVVQGTPVPPPPSAELSPKSADRDENRAPTDRSGTNGVGIDGPKKATCTAHTDVHRGSKPPGQKLGVKGLLKPPFAVEHHSAARKPSRVAWASSASSTTDGDGGEQTMTGGDSRKPIAPAWHEDYYNRRADEAHCRHARSGVAASPAAGLVLGAGGGGSANAEEAPRQRSSGRRRLTGPPSSVAQALVHQEPPARAAAALGASASFVDGSGGGPRVNWACSSGHNGDSDDSEGAGSVAGSSMADSSVAGSSVAGSMGDVAAALSRGSAVRGEARRHSERVLGTANLEMARAAQLSTAGAPGGGGGCAARRHARAPLLESSSGGRHGAAAASEAVAAAAAREAARAAERAEASEAAKDDARALLAEVAGERARSVAFAAGLRGQVAGDAERRAEARRASHAPESPLPLRSIARLGHRGDGRDPHGSNQHGDHHRDCVTDHRDHGDRNVDHGDELDDLDFGGSDGGGGGSAAVAGGSGARSAGVRGGTQCAAEPVQSKWEDKWARMALVRKV